MAGFLISFAPRVSSSNKKVSSKVKNLKKFCASLIFYYSGGDTVSGLVFIANTIINTVELKLDFLYTSGRYHIIFKILGRFNFNKLSTCVCYKMFLILKASNARAYCLHAQQGQNCELLKIVFEFRWHDNSLLRTFSQRIFY